MPDISWLNSPFVVALVLIAVGSLGMRRVWWFGWMVDLVVADKQAEIAALTADRDHWRDRYLQLLDTQGKQVGLMEEQVRVMQELKDEIRRKNARR